MLPHYVDNRLTDGDEIESLLALYPRKHILVLISVRLSKLQSHSAAGRIRFIKTLNVCLNLWISFLPCRETFYRVFCDN
jgi:hypothetical protein